MKKLMTMAMAAAALVFGVGIASAQPAHSRIDQRQDWQHDRMQQGRAYGQLTRSEMQRIRAGQQRIRLMELRANADGFVSPRERYRIQLAQQEQSALIWRLRHNDRRA